MDGGINRNVRFSSDMFGGMGTAAFAQVRSRAGSNFDFNDCFTNNNSEEHFFGGIQIKNSLSKFYG